MASSAAYGKSPALPLVALAGEIALRSETPTASACWRRSPSRLHWRRRRPVNPVSASINWNRLNCRRPSPGSTVASGESGVCGRVREVLDFKSPGRSSTTGPCGPAQPTHSAPAATSGLVLRAPRGLPCHRKLKQSIGQVAGVGLLSLGLAPRANHSAPPGRLPLSPARFGGCDAGVGSMPSLLPERVLSSGSGS